MRYHIKVSMTIIVLFIQFCGCQNEEKKELRYALKIAGENRSELKTVLKHYLYEDPDHEKLSAAKYLIINMPAHYSYRDTSSINSYYRKALTVFETGYSPDWQRDTLRKISDTQYWGITKDVVLDIKTITAEYLIYSIDHAFNQWRNNSWSKHLSFEEFRDWVLPYKVVELQSFDSWRDILSQHYSENLNTIPTTDIQRNTIYGAIEIVRNEIHSKQSEIGIRVLWEDRGSLPMRNADTWVHMTYGSCMDYVTMGVAVFRSMGFPAAIDQVPVWGRNSDGHSWYVFLDDHGQEQSTINSLIVPAGIPFYPYERIPKVWRNTYTINRNVVEYFNTALYVHPFEFCHVDVTDHYNLTSDLIIDIDRTKIKSLKDRKYVYIAMAVNSNGPDWRVLDFGKLKYGKACFNSMGRNMLYIVLGFDGNSLVPISYPFILQKNGKVEYVSVDRKESSSIELRRKYYESYNVADMRRRLLGGMFQCSDNIDFKNADTLYVIENIEIPYFIEINSLQPHRYWRYMSPENSWGSIAELSFYDKNRNKLTGLGIANPEAGQDAINRAFDGNMLSNFEINQPNGNWVGFDMLKPVIVQYASVSPRGDDNDICFGNEYELFYFDGEKWNTVGYNLAQDNRLNYNDIPINTLLWLHDNTRGTNERPFILRETGDIEWW